MLLELHVRNLALIEEADLELGEGLNILTGETGAGKSILIGSVNLALGQKAPKDMIRSGADSAYVELVFSVEEEKREALRALDVYPEEDGTLIITRRLMPARSISKINDETVTASKLKAVTAQLIDIHGQHEHQSLLHASKHLEILDTYAKQQIEPLKERASGLYGRYQALRARLESAELDQESRLREMEFLQFEIEEIQSAGVKAGEEEQLTGEYRRCSNGRRIMENLSAAYEAAEPDGIGRALRQVGEVAGLDAPIKEIQDQLYDAESLLEDVRRSIGVYLENTGFDQEELTRIEERLDCIHRLQAKYGNTAEAMERSLQEKKERLDQLVHFDEYRRQAEKEYKETEAELETVCLQLSGLRKQAASRLTAQIREGLADLNFLNVGFSMAFRRLPHYTAGGFDQAEFVIAANPGEPERPLGQVASGGELSRIMLAIKTVLADSDEIPTLIFDEIDTGISGRTAQKVAEKLAIISQTHQVICITHLPQIAAMADHHFEIAKSADGGKTKTRIRSLGQEEMARELARLLGGAQITDAVLSNAREMKALAEQAREKLGKREAHLDRR